MPSVRASESKWVEFTAAGTISKHQSFLLQGRQNGRLSTKPIQRDLLIITQRGDAPAAPVKLMSCLSSSHYSSESRGKNV